MADHKKPGWGAFLPRFNIPETFGAALSYEGQLHWFLKNWDEVAEYANELEQPTVTVGKTEFPDTSNALLPSITNSGTDINAVLDFTYPVIRTRFADPLQWDFDAAYDVLTVVSDGNGNSYTSRQAVPAHTPLADTDYWVLTGVYDASLQAIRDDVASVKDGYVRVYRTVADMQADTEILSGMICHTLGFYAAGDGGAAWYVVGSAEPNGMDVLQLATINTASMVIPKDSANPRMFGAVADGTTDDSERVRAAVNCGARTVDLLGLTYKADTVALTADGLTIDGGGAHIITGQKSGLIIRGGSHNVTVRGIKFTATYVVDSQAETNYSINVAFASPESEYDSTDIAIDSCEFVGGVFGIVATNVRGLAITNCKSSGQIFKPEDSSGGYGILLQSCQNVVVDNYEHVRGRWGRHALYISVLQTKENYRSNVNVLVSNCIFDYTSLSAATYYSPNNTAIAVRSTVGLEISNVRLLGGTAIVSAGNEDGVLTNVYVHDCDAEDCKYFNSTDYPAESRAVINFFGADGHVRVSRIRNLNPDSQLMQDASLSGSGAVFTYAECTPTNRVHIGDCSMLYVDNVCLTKTAVFHYYGQVELMARFSNISQIGTNAPFILIPEENSGLMSTKCINSDTFGEIYLSGSGVASYRAPHFRIPLAVDGSALVFDMKDFTSTDVMVTAIPFGTDTTKVYSFGVDTAAKTITLVAHDNSGARVNPWPCRLTMIG